MATDAEKLATVNSTENASKNVEAADQLKNANSVVDTAAVGVKKDAEELKTAATAASPLSGNDGPVTDTQKKMRRAERFGMPVRLSEQEKRNSRAERFGTGSKMHGSEVSKNSEELKRKARAERFGLPLPSSAGDEEVKKKARLARFASYPKTDSLEEDKRKARAIRFSETTSSSLSQVNGKGNIEPKAAITGKAGVGD